MDVFQIRLLGELSISYEDKRIQLVDNRARKLWLLLSYLLCHRRTAVPTAELIELLWGDKERKGDPISALKTTMHRLRALLDQLGPGVGHRLILHRGGGYAISDAVSLSIDTKRFDALCRAFQTATDPMARRDLALEATELYGGDLLPRFSSESFVIPLAAYYHNLYLQTLYATLDMLTAEGADDQIVTLCRRAISIEPYDETPWQHLIRHLLNMGEQQAAILAYERFNQLMMTEFSVPPSEALRALHREALRGTDKGQMDLDTIIQDVSTQGDSRGAFCCEYDFFKAIYAAEARMVARNGSTVHVALLTVTDAAGNQLQKRSLDVCMENLAPLLCAMLRQGDVIARCSASQYILLLPNANYENACMVMDRMLQQFGRRYPHSPAILRYTVQPLIPF